MEVRRRGRAIGHYSSQLDSTSRDMRPAGEVCAGHDAGLSIFVCFAAESVGSRGVGARRYDSECADAGWWPESHRDPQSDGTVWTVGADNYGQLGDDSTLATKKSPVQVSGLTGVVAVAAGENHGHQPSNGRIARIQRAQRADRAAEADHANRKAAHHELYSRVTDIVRVPISYERIGGGKPEPGTDCSSGYFRWRARTRTAANQSG